MFSGLGFQDEEQRNTVHLKAYPELDQLVTKASALAQAGRFAEALAIYDAAVEGHPNTVVPLDAERAWGVWEYVHDQIGRWPEEGRAFHRRRVDPLAEHAFRAAERTQDIDALERLIETYPYSSFVDDALALIGNFRLDAGESERAAEAFTRLLAIEGNVPRPVTIARLGLAWSRAGAKAPLEALAARAAADHPGAKVRVGPGEVDLQDHLRDLLRATKEGKPPLPPLAIPGWEMIGGAPPGTRLAESGVDLGPQAWSLSIAPSRYDADDDFGIRRVPTQTPTADFRPLHPAVSDGILYVRNETIVYALSFASRQPELLWQFPVPAPGGEVMFDNRLNYTLSVHEGRVFANLITAVDAAEDKLGYVRVKFPFPRRALFALDAYTGAVLWRLGGKLRADALEENATFSTAPTPEGDRLYVGAIKQKLNTDPFEHYLLCLEAATGRVLWSTFVGSGGTEINLFGNSTRESIGSPVAVSADSVYYCTNHGAIAAIEKKTGRLRWTYRYRQLPVNPTRSVYVMKNRLEWINSPPVVARGTVAVTPTDSALLYGLDAATGERRWQVPRSRDIRTLYGERGGTLVVGGERLEFYEMRTGKMAAPPLGDELGGTGRGVVAEDGVYVPCRDKLRFVKWDGTWDETRARSWPGGVADGGNLLVVDGAVVLATQDAVRVFFDRRNQEQAIRAELRKSPDDPAVLYRGGLRFLQSGLPDEAARLFGRVVELTHAGPRPEDERLARAARKRLYAVTMEMGRSDLAARQADRALERFELALAAAPDPASKVDAALMIARVHLARQEPAKAVAEYQKLLARHGEALVNGVRVFETARDAVAAVLSVSGRDVYAPFEAEAVRKLEAARRAGGGEAFAEVFRLFPNSSAAEEALLEAAAAFGKERRVEEEVALLRQFLREFPASPRVAEATASLVRALEKSGYRASARTFLRRMAKLPEDVRVTDEGKAVAAREFAERRLKSPEYAASSLAVPPVKLSPPLQKAPVEYTEKVFREGAPLRITGTPPASAARLTFMNYGGAVKAIDMDRGVEVWQFRVSSGLRFAAFLEDALILGEERGAARLNPATGEPEWRWESRMPLRGFALSGPMLYFLTTDPANENASTIGALDVQRSAGRNVAPAWTQNFDGVASSRVHAAGDLVVFTAVSPNRIHVFEADTGRRLPSSQAFSPGLAAQVIHVQEDLLILHAERRFIEAYDLPGGALRWRVNLERSSTRAVEVGPAGLVLLGTQKAADAPQETVFLAVVDLRTGKIGRIKEGLPIGDPRFMLLDGETAYVVSRDRTLRVFAVRLSDFAVAWGTDLGASEMTLLPPALAADHVVVVGFERGVNGLYAYAGVLLDKAGGVVQNIRSDFKYERPPHYGLANGQLIFSVDTKVDVHR